MNKLTKKFRFDSFATEFSEENINDNDSGIGEFFKILHSNLHTYFLTLDILL